MLFGSQGFAPVKLDASRDLIGVCDAVAQCSIDLRASQLRIIDQRRLGIGLLGKILNPYCDLPYIGTAEQSRPAPGRAIAEHDQRMLLTAGAFLGIATQTIRKCLTGSARPQT